MLKCCASTNSASFLSEEIQQFNESESNLDTNEDVVEMDYDESAQLFEDMDIHFRNTSKYALEINVNEDRKQKQRVRKDKSRKTLALEKLINCIGNKEEQNQVLHNVYQQNVVESVAYSNAESKLDRLISEGFITHLGHLKQKRKHKEFSNALVISFPEEIANKAFIQLIAKKLFMRVDRLLKMVQFWNENDEARGRKSLTTQERQMIYDEWVENRLRNTISTGRKEGQTRQ